MVAYAEIWPMLLRWPVLAFLACAACVRTNAQHASGALQQEAARLDRAQQVYRFTIAIRQVDLVKLSHIIPDKLSSYKRFSRS